MLLSLALLAAGSMLVRETWAEDPAQVALDGPALEEPVNEAGMIPLLARLSDDSFLVREKAMEEIWRIGPKALPALRKVVAGADPEASDRARELVVYISAGVLFDSPDEVKALVLKFSKSMDDDKLVILRRLIQLKQWRQALYLFRLEKNPELRIRMASLVKRVGVNALRQAIVKDDAGLAEEILDLLGDDIQSMLIRAWFYHYRGKPGQEPGKAHGPKGRDGSLWRMSKHRVSGNIVAAIDEARKAGEQPLADAWRVLEGDAMPWLLGSDPEQGRDAIYEAACALQVLRLQGKEQEALATADALLKLANDTPGALRVTAGLAANGYRDEALSVLRKHDTLETFHYYDTVELPQLGLEVLGIPKDAKPPYTDWVRKFTGEAVEQEDENLYHRLVALAGFLSARGQGEHALPVLEPMMSALEADGADVWFELLEDMQSQELAAEAMQFIKLRGNEHDEADLAVKHLLGRRVAVKSLGLVWKHVKKRNDRDIGKALDEMALLSGLVAEPGDKAVGLHNTLVQEAGQMGPAGQRDLLSALYDFCISRNDLLLASAMADELAGAGAGADWLQRKQLLDEKLMRWDKVEPVFAERAQSAPHDYHNLIKWYIALRKLGRDDQAAQAYRQAMLLSVGETSILNYWGLLLDAAGFEKEAVELWTQAAVLSHPEDADDLGFDYAMLYLADHSRQLYRDGEWKRAAAIGEVVSRIYMRGASDEISLQLLLRIRHHSELCHGMLLLKQGRREQAIKRLEKAHSLIPGDGLLADDFFPLIRKEKLGKVYERWFEESYQHVKAACELYPGSHNSHNTAAWLASRAVRRLDDAHEHARKALEMRPDQGAYLDTMAEVWFARGEREKALEWSRKAITASISGASGNPRNEGYVLANFQQLNKQYEYFKNDPLPGDAR